jgi:hypothetical protein
MAKITFRTADGRVVSFNSKGSKGRRRNPSDSPRYRAGSRVASAVDALDAAGSAALRAARKASKAKRVVKAVRPKARRVTIKRKAKRSTKDCAPTGARRVRFSDGRVVTFRRAAGCAKPAKARRGKSLYKRNNLSAFAFVKGPALKGKALQGKRKGQVFASGGKTYRMVSYVTKTGKRVRFALRVKASAK